MKLDILGYEYRVVVLDDLPEGAPMGQCDGAQRVIRLRARDHPEARLSTLLHEIIEAVNTHLNLELDNKTICPLETGLWQVLRANGVDLMPLLRTDG